MLLDAGIRMEPYVLNLLGDAAVRDQPDRIKPIIYAETLTYPVKAVN